MVWSTVPTNSEWWIFSTFLHLIVKKIPRAITKTTAAIINPIYNGLRDEAESEAEIESEVEAESEVEVESEVEAETEVEAEVEVEIEVEFVVWVGYLAETFKSNFPCNWLELP